MIDLDEDRVAIPAWRVKALAGAALLALIAAGAYHQWAAAQGAVDANGCPRAGLTSLAVVGIDTTDPLLAANPARVTATLNDVVGALPGGSKLAVVPIDAELATEPRLIFHRCAPVREGEGNALLTPKNPQRRARAEFDASVVRAVRRLSRASDANRSPLVEQIGAIVTDARIRANLPQERELVIFSDLLQASGSGNAYRGRLTLPAQPARILAGWRVRFIQTTNVRDYARQTESVREEWRRWAIAAGAISVSFEGSGFIDTATAP